MNRFFGPLARRVDTPWKMYPIGVLFGLGFDTATEVALLVLSGTAVASGLPFWAILQPAAALRRGDEPLRHAGRLLHELRLRLGVLAADPQGVLQPRHHRALGRGRLPHRHRRAARPARDRSSTCTGGFWRRSASFNINTAGFVIVGLFVVTWVVALAIWHFAKIESRWTTTPADDVLLEG